MKKRIYKCFVIFLSVAYIFTIPYTMAKFSPNIMGIAWQNYFTEFTQLQDIYFITDSDKDSGNLWGSSSSPTTDFTNGGETYYDANSFADNNNFKLDKLKNVEFNVYNQSSTDVVITFNIYYYAPKLGDKRVDSPHISFGVYNTYLHNSDETTVTNDSTVENYKTISTDVLKGEFTIDTGSGVWSTGEYEYIPEIPAKRSSDDNGTRNELRDWYNWGTYYYAHKAVINPYQIIKSSKIVDAQNNNTKPSYYDDSLLDEFICNEGEAYSFNMSLYYGDYGSSNSDSSRSFFTAVEIVAIPLSECQTNSEWNS